MVLSSILFLLFSTTSFGKSKLPLFKAKQAIGNIRYISSDGKFTYYQRRSGKLLLATNYKVAEVDESSMGTNYLFFAGQASKYLIYTKDNNFHDYLNIRKDLDIYRLKLGGTNSIKIGKGVNPRIHLNDQWVSYYSPAKKIIFFKNLEAPTISFKIKILNKKNPYFFPQVVMTNSDTIFYTDINEKGFTGVIKFSRKLSKGELFKKVPSFSAHVELCSNSNNFIIGEFSSDSIEKYSLITSYNIKQLDSSQEIYTSKLNDIGNILCPFTKNDIFFIKAINKNGKIYSEASKLNILTKKVKILSDLKFTSQIIKMDKNILIPYRGKFYVIEGQASFANTDTLKK